MEMLNHETVEGGEVELTDPFESSTDQTTWSLYCVRKKRSQK
jgi:hypothetical protein